MRLLLRLQRTAVFLMCLKEISQTILKQFDTYDGTVLLGPSIGIKQALVEKLNNDISNRHNERFQIFGDGKHKIGCNQIEIKSNKIYIYTDHLTAGQNNSDTIMDLCYAERHPAEQLTMISSAVRLPIFADNFIDIEFFGAGTGILSDYVSQLPVYSTMITSSTTGKVSSKAIIDEVFFKSITSGIKNPFMKYISYIMLNPDDTCFAIRTLLGSKIFCSNINSLDGFTDDKIRLWQNLQIKNFIDFYLGLYDEVRRNIWLEFSDIAYELYSDFDKKSTLPVWYTNLQNENISKFKEMLFFKFITRIENDKVFQLLELGIDKYITWPDGTTATMTAAFFGNNEILKYYIEHAVDVNAVKKNNITALMAAVTNNQIEGIESLLKEEADPNIENNSGFTALMISSMQSNIISATMLLKAGAKINAVSKTGISSLMVAVDTKNETMVDFFLKNGADTELLSNKGSAISNAITYGSCQMVQLLLSYGANLSSAKFNPDYSFNKDQNCIDSEVWRYSSDPIEYIRKNNKDIVGTIIGLTNLQKSGSNAVSNVTELIECILANTDNICSNQIKISGDDLINYEL